MSDVPWEAAIIGRFDFNKAIDEHNPDRSIALSQAISLKRIADALEKIEQHLAPVIKGPDYSDLIPDDEEPHEE